MAYEILNGMKITSRERDIIEAILDGDTDHKSIAKRLDISPLTAQEHTGNLRRKLGIESKSALVKWINKTLRGE